MNPSIPLVDFHSLCLQGRLPVNCPAAPIRQESATRGGDPGAASWAQRSFLLEKKAANPRHNKLFMQKTPQLLPRQ